MAGRVPVPQLKGLVSVLHAKRHALVAVITTSLGAYLILLWSRSYPVAGTMPSPDIDWAEPRDETIYPAWTAQHNVYVHAAEAARKGFGLDLVWYGDSITESYRSTSMGVANHPGVKDVFERIWGRYKTEVFAIAGDLTDHLAWRLLHGEGVQGLRTKVAVLLIGINDVGTAMAEGEDMQSAAGRIADRVKRIAQLLLSQDPHVHLVVQGILPSGGGNMLSNRFSYPSAVTQCVDTINLQLERFCSNEGGGRATYVNCGKALLTESGKMLRGDLIPDTLHPNAGGHAAMAPCLQQVIVPLLGQHA